MNANRSHRFIVGLDYGTTYSGISYVTSNMNSIEDIEVMSQWPGFPDIVWKTPSKMAYASENPRLNADQWGYAVPFGSRSYTWTKLLLDKDARLTEYDDPTLKDLFGDGMLRLPPGKRAPDVCQDYLHGMYLYLVSTLEKRFTPQLFRVTPMECWITVPAIWSDKARSLTRKAAIKAGFGSRLFDVVNVISEPEAAALTVLKPHIGETATDPFKPNDSFMVCDYGGGTVDITSYTILQCYPTLEFREQGIGSGGKCGSTYIDRNFNQWMSREFGDAYTSLSIKRRGPGSKFMRSFEHAKKSFGSPEMIRPTIEIEDLHMNAPSSRRYDPEEGIVIITSQQMEQFFAPVVNDIVSLIENQMHLARRNHNCHISRLILVGGFGDSNYLNQRLRQWCEKNGQVQLTCPRHCQTAVVKGAALRGLEGIKPKLRQCRHHYGVGLDYPFRDGIDPESKSYIHKLDGSKRCADGIHWFVRKGECIDEFTNCKHDFTLFYHENGPYRTKVQLYSCDRDAAPDYSDHFSVEKVGEINIELSREDLGSVTLS